MLLNIDGFDYVQLQNNTLLGVPAGITGTSVIGTNFNNKDNLI